MNRIMKFKERFMNCGPAWQGRPPDVVYAKDIIEAKAKFQENWSRGYEFMFLDHDLGGRQMVGVEEDNTGSGFVRWMIEKNLLPPYCHFIIHSFNPVGADNMYNMLKSQNRLVEKVPAVWDNDVFYKTFRYSLMSDNFKIK